MGRQQDLITANNSLDDKRFKFTLYNQVFGTLVLSSAPDGYLPDEFEFVRDMKYFGVFNKYTQNEIKFVKEGRDYIQNCYEAFGVNAEATLLVEELDPNTLIYAERFSGAIDFNTYKINEISADVQIIDNGFTSKIFNREAVDVDLLRDVAIDGQAINSAPFKYVKIPGVNIVQSAVYGRKASNVYTADHVVPMQLITSEFSEAVTPDNIYGSYLGAFFRDASVAYTNLNFAGNIVGRIRFNGVVPEVELYWTLNRYNNAGGIISSTLVEIIGRTVTDRVDFDFTFNEIISLNAGDYLQFEMMIIPGMNYEVVYTGLNATLSNAITATADRNVKSLLYHEAFERVVAQYTGEINKVYSDFLGRTDLGYSTDGLIGAISTGRFIRRLTGNNETLSTNLKDLFDALSIYCIGLGIVNGALRIEPMDFWFKTNIVLDLSDRIETETIEKEVIPELLANALKIGFKSYEYDRSGGIFEFNTASDFTTILKINNGINIISPFRADTTGILKLIQEADNSKDTNADEHIFLLDLVRDLVDYKLRTNEGFDYAIGGTDTDQNYNLLLSPARTLYRWGRYFRAMLERWQLSRIRWQSSEKSTTLKSKATGEPEVAENADIVVNNLATPLWHPEKYVIESYISLDEFKLLQAAPHGLIKLADDKFGWVLNVKCNNSNKKTAIQLLRANLDYVTPSFVQHGNLYNWYSLIEKVTVITEGLYYNWYAATDARGITAEGWKLPSKADFTILSDYVGGYMIAARELKEAGTTWWISNPGATNQFGFNARGHGNRSQLGTFVSFKETLYLFISDIYSSFYGMHVRFYYGNDSLTGIVDDGLATKKYGNSIRPVKITTTLSHGETGTYTDPSGIVYPTICIGTQEWVSCNIATRHYRNGDSIPEVIGDSAWAALTTGALSARNHDWDNVSEIEYRDRIAPAGWALPTIDQLNTLYLDSLVDPDKFNYTSIGIRLPNGPYSVSAISNLWSRDEFDEETAFYKSDETANVDKNMGLQARFVRLSNVGWVEGDVLTIEGVEYRTAQASDGTVWMIDNLKAKKYSDGTSIEYIIGNNAAWAADLDGAMCAFNDDDSTI